VKKITAFIPAAGLGERLRPITDHIPKPLLPVLGQPIIETVLEKISRLPIQKTAINVHYKRELFLEWLDASDYEGKISVFFEVEILGTGGALKNVARLLAESPFLVHNSDIVSDINLEMLLENHLSSGNMVTLAVHDFEEFNNVWVDDKGSLEFVGNLPPKDQGLRKTAFTGIAMYSPGFLDVLDEGRSSVVDAWLRAAALGHKVGTLDFTGCYWSDIGTPRTYFSMVLSRLREEGESLYIHPSSVLEDVQIGTHTVIERDVIIENGVSLSNCIILPGSRISAGRHIHNSIVGPGYSVPIEENLSEISDTFVSSLVTSGSAERPEISLIGNGGSDRAYYRIRNGDTTAVLLESPQNDPDFERHLIYTEFMRKHDIPVPEILEPDYFGHNMLINQGVRRCLFEDLGDLSLYSWVKSGPGLTRIKEIYRRVMDILVHLHSTVTDKASECPLLFSRVFDYDHLRWESGYFIERFVRGAKRISPADPENLEREFEELAKRVDSFIKSVIHRDFQSQNIMVVNGDVPRIIDYQGARMGPPAYDVVSLLWDPYVSLDKFMRDDLLSYYITKIRERVGHFDEAGFRETILPCRLQRHMQALGAYAFLAMVKGKKYFLKYVPQALRYLREETELAREEYPALFTLVQAIGEG
jgi:NDP-sugar pyrophosphorylase family protein/aminoglycoside/choline kinase family phosphotransferase